jgi:hypothetical protein
VDERRWRDPAWLGEAEEWIDSRLHAAGVVRIGASEQPHVYPWATVLRVPTDAGDVWFKANADSLRHEAAVVERIAARRAEIVAPLLAVDTATGWMLMADAGESLRTLVARERSLDGWHEVLPLYARLQLELESDVDDLLGMGVPDMRLAQLPSAYERLMDEIDAEPRFRDAGPVLSEMCRTLASYGLPELLQHDDLHDGQIFVRDGCHRVLDWGDACVSHPFFTLSVTLEGVLAWGLDDEADSVDIAPFRDAYLAPYAERFGPSLTTADLTAAATLGLRLGWACRAVNGHVPGDDAATHTRLRMFLDGHP